jgi:hypothetical protein
MDQQEDKTLDEEKNAPDETVPIVIYGNIKIRDVTENKIILDKRF